MIRMEMFRRNYHTFSSMKLSLLIEDKDLKFSVESTILQNFVLDYDSLVEKFWDLDFFFPSPPPNHSNFNLSRELYDGKHSWRQFSQVRLVVPSSKSDIESRSKSVQITPLHSQVEGVNFFAVAAPLDAFDLPVMLSLSRSQKCSERHWNSRLAFSSVELPIMTFTMSYEASMLAAADCKLLKLTPPYDLTQKYSCHYQTSFFESEKVENMMLSLNQIIRWDDSIMRSSERL